MSGFFSWLAAAIGAVWNRLFVRGDAMDSRENAAFQQSLEVNNRIVARIERVEEKADRLLVQNADQAAQMRVQQQQINECREHHKECEEDRVRLTATVSGLHKRVNDIDSKLAQPNGGTN